MRAFFYTTHTIRRQRQIISSNTAITDNDTCVCLCLHCCSNWPSATESWWAHDSSQMLAAIDRKSMLMLYFFFFFVAVRESHCLWNSHVSLFIRLYGQSDLLITDKAINHCILFLRFRAKSMHVSNMLDYNMLMKVQNRYVENLLYRLYEKWFIFGMRIA